MHPNKIEKIANKKRKNNIMLIVPRNEKMSLIDLINK